MKRIQSKPLLVFLVGLFVVDLIGKYLLSNGALHLYSIFDIGFTVMILLCVFFIVSYQNKFITKTLESENKFRKLFESANDAIYLFELTEAGMPGKFVEINQIACKRFGYSRDELLTMSPLDITSTNRLDKVAETQKNLLKYGKLTFEGEYVDKDGNLIPSEIHVSIFNYKKKNHALAISRDITERKKTEELVYKMAYYDLLTCLPNRRLFEEQLAKTLKEIPIAPKNHAVMFLDLDGFKQINDTFGHDIGDALLQTIALRLKNVVRGNDLVSRRSGDEFTILLPNITEDDAIKVAERIIHSFLNHFIIDDHEITSSCSIGISFLTSAENNLETILRQADLAMYEAKHKGKNTFHIYEEKS